MRFLVDENLDPELTAMLRTLGHDVLSASESHRSEADPNLAVIAARTARTVITADYDFNDISRAMGVTSPGMMLLSSRLPTRLFERRVLETIVTHGDVLDRAFINIDPIGERVRIIRPA